MRYLFAILTTLLCVSCTKQSSIEDSKIMQWGQDSSVTARTSSAVYMLPFEDGHWIAISTSYQKEKSETVAYTGGEVLKSGFLVYPGETKVNTLEEAIAEAKRIEASW
ncbi:MAG: hypothetical protein ACPG6P_06795 [Akkermansiaceae bacterium]